MASCPYLSSTNGAGSALKHWPIIGFRMVRAISFFSMGGLFLVISPNLRATVAGLIESFEHQLELYSPLSYVGCGVAVLLTVVISFYRGAQAR